MVMPASYFRELRAKLKAEGVCIRCRKRPAKKGILVCEKCDKDTLVNGKKRRKERAEVGLCLCKAPLAEGATYCVTCLENQSLCHSRLAHL